MSDRLKTQAEIAAEKTQTWPRRIQTINLDFDGTVVTHEFPLIGKDVGAVPVLRELVAAGWGLILFTMRSDTDKHGPVLTQAVEWFERHGIPLYGIQRNPTQDEWTSSPKSYAPLMIDDSALGCPLTMSEKSRRPYVDWPAVRRLLVGRGILPGEAVAS